MEKFSGAWWDNFLEQTNNLTKTSVLKNCMSLEETSLLRGYVIEVLRTLSKLRTDEYGFRVYEEDMQLRIPGMNRFYDTPPKDGETIEDWSKRMFGNKKFGMIINQVERLNLNLARSISFKTLPLFKKIGYPRGGTNITIFIGNYDKTPLGIHIDPEGDEVMHFHLGPNGKTMYTWNKDEYESLNENKPNIKELLPYSEEHCFDEGDMYFMPHGVYHVGEQEGLSIAVTFWRSKLTKSKLVTNLQNVIFNKYLEKDSDVLSADNYEIDDARGLDDVLSIYKIPDKIDHKSLMKQAYTELRYSLKSNGGYRTTPFIIKEKVIFEKNDMVQLNRPFKILFRESLNGEALEIFARGHKFHLANFDCIKLFLDEINKGKPLKVGTLYGILDDEWDENIGHFILESLFKHNGIQKA